jgi:hypothetical protein
MTDETAPTASVAADPHAVALDERAGATDMTGAMGAMGAVYPGTDVQTGGVTSGVTDNDVTGAADAATNDTADDRNAAR